MTVPYSSPQPQSLVTLPDTNIVQPTNGQVLAYDAGRKLWINNTGGGGGGATINGTNDAVVFKDGINGDADAAGITRTAGANFTMNLDTANKRVGIGITAPAVPLDVRGVCQITDSVDTLKIDGDEVGNVGANTLKLYSNNTTTADALTEIDAQAKKCESSTFRSKNPTSNDAPNGTDTAGIYKISLRRGFPQQAGGGLWDQQESYDPTQTSFPTGQTTEYQNTLPIPFPVIIGRTATGVQITPASVYVISNFGSTVLFADRCIYDPCQMRSRKQLNGWVWAGAPVQYRSEETRAMLNVKWFFQGRWSGSNTANRVHLYVNQFRSGVLLRQYLCHISNNADSAIFSGERTFMGFANYGEDIDWGRDDFQVEIANQAPSDNIRVDLAQCELKFILAQ